MNKLNQNTSFIKIIAVISMLIDHIGVLLLDNNNICRIIGRLAFPLFFFCIFIGYFKTKNFKKYIFRLFILFLITQPIYYLAFNTFTLNVCLSFIIELLFLYALDHKKYFIYLLIFTISLYLILFGDYMIDIILLTPIFYYTKNTKWFFSISYICFYLLIVYLGMDYIYLFNILAIPFMIIKTKYKININKYFFYGFYPCHLAILCLIRFLIN